MANKKTIKETTAQDKTLTKFIVNDFPAGTDCIYLTGSCEELGNWAPDKAIKMQYYQNVDTGEKFIASVALPKNTIVEYKYLNHPTWENVECGVVAEEVPNRTITLKNTKTRTVEDRVAGFRL